MGRGARYGRSEATAGNRTGARAARLLERLGASPSLGVTRLDDIFEALAEARGWQEIEAPIALRLVDALVQNDLQDFARQAMRLRRTLEANGLGHDAVRVSAGLQIQRAVPVIGWIHGHSPVDASERIRRAVARSKAAGVFPWHLLDG